MGGKKEELIWHLLRLDENLSEEWLRGLSEGELIILKVRTQTRLQERVPANKGRSGKRKPKKSKVKKSNPIF